MSHLYHSYIGTAKFQAPSAGQPKSDAAFVWSCCNCTCFVGANSENSKLLDLREVPRSPIVEHTPLEESENHLGNEAMDAKWWGNYKICSVILRVSPWYCQRAISDLIKNGWRDTWVLHHMKHTFTPHTSLPPGRTTRFSKVQQRINIHHFGIPDAKRMPMCFSGCPLGIVNEPFQASSKMDGVTLESFITWSTPSHHIITSLPPGRTIRFSKVQQRINIHHFGIPDTERMPMCFSGCPLGIVNEPFQASSKMDGVTLESFITWSTPSHHIPRFHPVEPPAFQKCNNASTFITLAFLTPNECQSVSQGVPLVLSTSHFRPHRKWMAWHLSPSSHEAHLHITYHASTR